MKLKYRGSLARLQKHVFDCGALGEWSRLEEAQAYQFRSGTREILNWWPSTGTIFFQGRTGSLQRRFTAVFANQIANDDGDYVVNSRAIIG